MKNVLSKKPTLDERMRYEVVFAGGMDTFSLNWGVTVEIVPSCHESCEVTIVTGVFDQAALHGLLRNAYTLGFPLISVNRIEESVVAPRQST